MLSTNSPRVNGSIHTKTSPKELSIMFIRTLATTTVLPVTSLIVLSGTALAATPTAQLAPARSPSTRPAAGPAAAPAGTTDGNAHPETT
jgi:hypothetical protein